MFLAAPLVSTGQDITVSAKVVDKETSEPLEYASVGLKSVAIGTISNEQGEFDFHITANYRNEVLVVSMLGYKNFEAPVWSLTGETQVIKMEKSPIVLQEVVVSDTLQAQDILEIALARIEQNYPMQPFMLDGFYRDVKKVGGTHISLLEAAVRIYDDNYAEPRNKYKLRESVRLIEVRQSLGYESRFTTYFDQDNLLEDLLLHNNIRYRHFEDGEKVFSRMVRDKNSYYNDHETYVIFYKGDYFMKMYIDTADFSIIHMDFEQGFEDEYIGRRNDLVSKFAGIKKSIDYRKIGGKMYPSFIAITSRINWYDSETSELKFETELFQQLLINKVTPNAKERIRSTEKMRNYGLQFQDRPYNKQFWDNYNVIKETPLDQQILRDLEKHAPLKVQFEGN
ncbi:MAG TPA: carboxypeptidase-like regulatory domain-containing protein [Chryseosolibacter sp.]|nr:carboxypeptidase-like regulatory domain-containing protein [Chryseosolibacter sp.]